MQAEAADGVSFAEPLRRYANSVAGDLKLCHRGVLIDGELKTSAALTKQPQARPFPTSGMILDITYHICW